MDEPKIVSREVWGALVPRTQFLRIPLPTPRVWIHHLASEQHGPIGVREIEQYHVKVRRWRAIAYSFLIDDDGVIYEGRGVGIAGGHTKGDNTRSHAICLMGNFEKRKPTKEAIESLVHLAQWGQAKRWWIPTLGGHKDAPGAATLCPGKNLYYMLPNIRRSLILPPPPSLVKNGDDEMLMIYTTRPNTPVFMVSGDKIFGIKQPEDRARLLQAGVKQVLLSPDTYDEWVARGREP